jgi:hypothetical protein
VNTPTLGENPLARRRDSVLRKTEDVEPSVVTPEERPAESDTRASENRIQFVLSPRHLQILDDLCYHTRKATGYKLNRSEIVRALIEELETKAINVQRIRSEKDVYSCIHDIMNT